jgi:hypothetical protein
MPHAAYYSFELNRSGALLWEFNPCSWSVQSYADGVAIPRQLIVSFLNTMRRSKMSIFDKDWFVMYVAWCAGLIVPNGLGLGMLALVVGTIGYYCFLKFAN